MHCANVQPGERIECVDASGPRRQVHACNMAHPQGRGRSARDGWTSLPVRGWSQVGTPLIPDGGLLVRCELDDAPGFCDLANCALRESHLCKQTAHRRDGLIRQSIHGRLAGYEDVKAADRLARDRGMPQVAGGMRSTRRRPPPRKWAGSRPRRWPMPENREALAGLNGQWIKRFHGRKGLNCTVIKAAVIATRFCARRRSLR